MKSKTRICPDCGKEHQMNVPRCKDCIDRIDLRQTGFKTIEELRAFRTSETKRLLGL